MENCIQVDSRSLFSYRFVYVDIKDHISESILKEYGVYPFRVKEMARKDSPFRLIVCSIRKRDIRRFKEALSILKNRILILGYNDYDDFCIRLTQAKNIVRS